MAERYIAGNGSETFTPTDWLTGNKAPVTGKITVLSGEGVVPAKSVLGIVTASGKARLSATGNVDGSEVAKLILVEEIDATSGDVDAAVYLEGYFNPDLLNLGTGHTEASVTAELRERGIHLRAPA